MGFEGSAEENDVPDVTAEEVQDIGRRIEEAAMRKNLDDLSPEDLASLGIKKTVNEHGTTVYDYGYSPDTGLQTKQANIKVEVVQKPIDAPEVAEAARQNEILKVETELRRASGNPDRLPSSDEE
ncbi:MAG: hypothetical protein CEO12_588 [Parcubacteria group bacterium Gr01-1014_46]|nr:MAG: hypothetical protein CEO12_588 [Parcubacteria group bacterium Gr01-1014_46]